MLSRIFIRRRELAQFIRKTGSKTIQLWSIDRTTRGVKPQTTQVHRPYNSGELDWDINKHRSSQDELTTLHGRIGTSTQATTQEGLDPRQLWSTDQTTLVG
jgi:hypothetical protein